MAQSICECLRLRCLFSNNTSPLSCHPSGETFPPCPETHYCLTSESFNTNKLFGRCCPMLRSDEEVQQRRGSEQTFIAFIKVCTFSLQPRRLRSGATTRRGRATASTCRGYHYCGRGTVRERVLWSRHLPCSRLLRRELYTNAIRFV